MRKIALLHTVHSVCDSFEGQLRKAVKEELLIYNTLDEFLAMNARPVEEGRITENNKKRLALDLMCAELTGAEALIVTCSSLTPIVRDMRRMLNIPVFCIDEPMLNKAAAYGKVLVLATAKSTEAPTRSFVEEASGGRTDIIFRLDEQALDALKAGDREGHDRRVMAMAEDAGQFDAVVLAQASMAHLAQALSEKYPVPVLDSPSMCIESVVRFLNEGRKENVS